MLFPGIIDEVRISDTARSAAWIKACYENQNSPSTFSICGEEILAQDNMVIRAERMYPDGNGPSQVYVPGADYEMAIRIEYVGSLTEMEVQDTPPTGWTFVSVGGPNPPDTTPGVGATGSMWFGWNTPPSSPSSFTYKVHVPSAEEGDKSFSGGKVLYRGDGDELQHVVLPDPFLVHLDTDGDGLSDEEEAAIGTNPLNPDTDGDG